MIGIPRLAPISKPVEGMQVVAYSSIFKCTEGERAMVPGYIWLEGNGKEDWVKIKDCYQIVIEYEREWLPQSCLTENEKASDYMVPETLPLHPEDWQKALSLIGKEIEFESTSDLFPKSGCAKLILPKQEESWEDIRNNIVDDPQLVDDNFHISMEDLDILMEYFKHYYHPPKRLKQ